MIKGIDGIICFIGIGANLARPAAQCLEAIKRIQDVPGISVLRRSSLYRTEPMGPVDQDWFVNAVIEVRTLLSPAALLQSLQAIERAMGRQRAERWGPRIIDLDILFHGQNVVQEDGLIIPHPELHKRRFVLEPLAELAGYLIHPSFGVSIRGLLDRLSDAHKVEWTDS